MNEFIKNNIIVISSIHGQIKDVVTELLEGVFDEKII